MFKLKTRKDDEDGIIYGDVTNRLFAWTIDLILFYPISLLLNILVFPHGDQRSITNAKVFKIHPEMRGDFFARAKFIINNYPADYAIIVHQENFMRLLLLALLGVYVVFFTYRYGATPGKMIMGLKVADQTTRDKLTFSQCIIRYISYLTGFSIIFAGMRHDKRTWGDFIADTIVIYNPERWYKRHADKAKGRVRKFFNLP